MRYEITAAGAPRWDADFDAWVAANGLEECHRLLSTNNALTEWVGDFYVVDGGQFVVCNGGPVSVSRSVLTSPAKAEWVAA